MRVGTKQLNVLSWADFYTQIVLKRIKTSTDVTYVGEYKSGSKTYTAEFNMSRSSFEGNLEDLEYIDQFAKNRIAKDICKQINGAVLCR
jgi:hypothetical protein